jgi:hypothetical protein
VAAPSPATARPSRQEFFSRRAALCAGALIEETQAMNNRDEPARNEGEGNRTAARRYNEAQRKFVESGKVEDAAKDAEHALETDEAEAMKRAEEEGRSHARPHEQSREI